VHPASIFERVIPFACVEWWTQTLPEGVEEEEAKAVKLYIPMLKHYLNAAASAAENRVLLQVEVLIALQDFYVVSDNPICTFLPP